MVNPEPRGVGHVREVVGGKGRTALRRAWGEQHEDTEARARGSWAARSRRAEAALIGAPPDEPAPRIVVPTSGR